MRETDPRRPTRKLVLALAREGIPARQIAEQLGLTRARVYQHLRRLRADGELPEDGR
jgi:predicted ArsR family transcriptional regulator